MITIYTAIAFVNFMFPTFTNADANRSEMGSYELFLSEEAEEYTGVIDKGVEKELNMKGVFDSDIRTFDDATIQNLNSGEQFTVEVQYFEEVDDEIKQLPKDEVEDYFREVYSEGKDKKLHKGESISVKEKEKKEKSIFEKIGLEEEVLADTKKTLSESGMLRTVLIAYQSTIDKKNIHTCAVAEWLSEPKHRLNDYLCISCHGKDSIFDDKKAFGATYQYDLYFHTGSTSPQVFTNKDTKSVEYISNGFYTFVNLCDDAASYYVKNHKIFLNGYFYVNDYDRDGKIFIYVKYAHQQKKLQSNISVNVNISPTGGISFGLSSGTDITSYYNIISKVPSLTLDYCVNPVYK